jgi:hypothetical protein
MHRLSISALSLALACVLLACAGLAGCKSASSPELEKGESLVSFAQIPADQYANTFQAARDVLRDRRFILDRVDAPQGILTSEPSQNPGLARPWNAMSGLAQAVEDVVQYQQRVVRVAFVPINESQSGNQVGLTNPDRNLLLTPAETVLQVRVSVERIERPGVRTSPDSVRLRSRTIDPTLEAAGVLPTYAFTVRDDEILARTLAQDILNRSKALTPSASAASTP